MCNILTIQQYNHERNVSRNEPKSLLTLISREIKGDFYFSICQLQVWVQVTKQSGTGVRFRSVQTNPYADYDQRGSDGAIRLVCSLWMYCSGTVYGCIWFAEPDKKRQ